MPSSPPRQRRRLRSNLPLLPPSSHPRLRWADQLGSNARGRADASTAPGNPLPVAVPPCPSSSAWLTPASSSRLAAIKSAGSGRRPWWIYTATSAIASAVLSFVALSWAPGEAAAELPREVAPAIQVISFDPQALADAELPSLRTGDPRDLREAGLRLARRGKHAKALPYLEAAATHLPDDPALELQLGDTRLAIGEVDLARQHYRAAEAAGCPEAALRLRLLGS